MKRTGWFYALVKIGRLISGFGNGVGVLQTIVENWPKAEVAAWVGGFVWLALCIKIAWDWVERKMAKPGGIALLWAHVFGFAFAAAGIDAAWEAAQSESEQLLWSGLGILMIVSFWVTLLLMIRHKWSLPSEQMWSDEREKSE